MYTSTGRVVPIGGAALPDDLDIGRAHVWVRYVVRDIHVCWVTALGHYDSSCPAHTHTREIISGDLNVTEMENAM